MSREGKRKIITHLNIHLMYTTRLAKKKNTRLVCTSELRKYVLLPPTPSGVTNETINEKAHTSCSYEKFIYIVVVLPTYTLQHFKTPPTSYEFYSLKCHKAPLYRVFTGIDRP